jgi:hypothetical protein
MIKKYFQTILPGFLFMLIGYLWLSGVNELARRQAVDFREQSANGRGSEVCLLSETYITGPPAADVGELCVFHLNDPTIRADWTVIRQTDQEAPAVFYIDTSGAALTFSSNIPAKYTIIAAIAEEGRPKILQHVCLYGLTPGPSPTPHPNPDPQPTPEPSPPATLTEWVRQNVPDVAQEQRAVLASIYGSTAAAIDKGTIRSQAAAFSSIRTNTQAKIKPGTWEKFLDDLAVQIESKLGGSTDIKTLGLLFREIADGLKARPEVPAFFEVACPDPTGAACQTPTTIRRSQ